jgi:hypothetical protein
MEAVILSSPSLNGQEVFLRFTPSGQTEYIDLGLVLLPYTFYFESLVPPLANKAGVFFIYCSGLQCTYEVTVNDIPPTPTPSNTPTPTVTPTITVTTTPTITPTITVTPTITTTPTITPTITTTPTVTPSVTPTCSVIPNLSVTNLTGFVLSSNTFGDLSENIITLSGSNTSIGQSLGNTYYWYSGSTDITPTGNTQVISFNLSEHLSAFTINFVCINSLGCGNTLPVTIVPFLPAYIDILNITDDNGCGNGSITFQVVGGYPPPPYGTSETYFVYDESFSHSDVTQTDTPITFSGYSSGTTQLFASSYTYGASPSTAFTINYVPCDPLPTLFVFNGGPYCEGSAASFFIFADPDVSWEFINPLGVTINTGTGNGGYLISPTTFSDSGMYTLTGCSTSGCYVQTSDYLTINSDPYVQYVNTLSDVLTYSNPLSFSGFCIDQFIMNTSGSNEYYITEFTINSSSFNTSILISPPFPSVTPGSECDDLGGHPNCDIILALTGQGYTYNGDAYTQVTINSISIDEYTLDFCFLFSNNDPVLYIPNSMTIEDLSGNSYNISFNYVDPCVSDQFWGSYNWYSSGVGYIEIGIAGGDGSYSISDGGLYSTFGSPAIFNNVTGPYNGYFSISDGNLCNVSPPLAVSVGLCLCNTPSYATLNSNTLSIGGPFTLSASGGTTYRFYKLANSQGYPFDVTVTGDTITGATVTVTSNFQISDFGTYYVEVTNFQTLPAPYISPSPCTSYGSITIPGYEPTYVNIISTTDDNGSNNGTVTFDVTGGIPIGLGLSETFYAFDSSFINQSYSIVSGNTYTFSGYPQNSYGLFASGITFGQIASTGFTINYTP